MANVVVAYLKKSINPGGTPRRMKEWMGAMLLFHMSAIVFPTINMDNISVADISLISATVLGVTALWASTYEKYQVLYCKIIFIAGLAMQFTGAIAYHSDKADFVIGCSWGLAMFINERRYYITFNEFMYSVLLMISVLAANTIVSIYDTGENENAMALVSIGMFTIICNVYLLLVDYKYGKQRTDYFERLFDKIQELTLRLSTILTVDKPIEQVMWDVTRECIPMLSLEDFVIYLYDERKNRLIQVAAYGQKGNNNTEVINPIEIEPSKGVVGRVFSSAKPLLIPDLSHFDGYIVDDEARQSELAVPILIGDKVFGVIDSEHSQLGYFKQMHLQLFNVIAAFCSIKAAQQELRMQQLAAEKDRLEVLKLKELEQLKNRFITNISHDLKTPLSLILGPATQMFKTSEDELVKRQAGYIMKNTDHLMKMVEQLLQLNTIEQGKAVLNIETVDLASLLNEIVMQYELHAEEHNIGLHVSVAADIVIETDSYKLSQCIHNLLLNALKHTPSGGDVLIVADKSGKDKIRISVKDTGVGVAAEEQSKIFDRFYKVDVNNHKGTGIGLSLVKEFVGYLKGSVEVVSSLGNGAEFIIVIPQHIGDRPLVKNVGDNEPQQEVDEVNSQPLIVIAEDHAELNAFIAHSLQQEGYRCLQAYNGKEALGMIEEYIPDIVVTDLMMPEMSGEELVAVVRDTEKIAHVPVVVLTAKNQVNDRVELYQTGADNYIAKPFKMDELLAVIEATLKQRRRLRDKFFNAYMANGAPLLPSYLVVNSPEVESPTDIAINEIVKQCTDYVLKHLDDPDLNVNTLGLSLGMGRNRLQKEIKTATGLTPVEFIRSVRLHEAYKMLESSSHHNISEIAYMTGFSNLSYFSRSFKGQFGVAPTEVVRSVV